MKQVETPKAKVVVHGDPCAEAEAMLPLDAARVLLRKLDNSEVFSASRGVLDGGFRGLYANEFALLKNVAETIISEFETNSGKESDCAKE